MKTNQKSKIDRSSALTILSMTFAFALVVALSFGTRFFFRPGIDEGFWGDLVLSVALCVYCLYFGIPEAKNYYQKKENGRYQRAMTDFLSVRKECLLKDTQFNQWLDNYYEKNKTDYYLSILSLHGSIKQEVLDLDYSELINLSHPYKKVWDDTEFAGRKPTYFRSMTDEQIEIIRDIYKGKIKVERIPDDFFKTLNGKVVTSEYIAQAKANKKNTWQYVSLILFRLLLVVAFSVVLTIFGVKISDAATKEETLNRVIQMITRIWNMSTSFVYGFTVGRIMTLNESQTLEYKFRVNSEFLNDKTFVAISDEEIAKKEFEKYEKEIEETKKNVIVPEVLQIEEGNKLCQKSL